MPLRARRMPVTAAAEHAPLLFCESERKSRRRRPVPGIGSALLFCTVMAMPLAASAQDGPVSDPPLRDAQFGVSTTRPGLQRRVEMYQWRREGEGFVTDWVSRAVDSSGFPPAMANPARMPVPARDWIAESVHIDGHPLDPEVLRRLGHWQRFRPGFSALPGHVGARYQPEGDGLGSAEDPQYPRVGDVRITWHELRLPSLAGRVDLVDGRWRLARPAAAEDVAGSVAGGVGAVEPRDRPNAEPGPTPSRGGALTWSLAALLLGALLLLWSRRR